METGEIEVGKNINMGKWKWEKMGIVKNGNGEYGNGGKWEWGKMGIGENGNGGKLKWKK